MSLKKLKCFVELRETVESGDTSVRQVDPSIVDIKILVIFNATNKIQFIFGVKGRNKNG